MDLDGIIFEVYDEKGVLTLRFNLHDVESILHSLVSCSLVCHAWTATCQQLLFSRIILFGSSQFDKLFHLLRSSNSSPFLRYTRRISINYKKPHLKLGEVLPRIAILNPPNLRHIDIYPEAVAVADEKIDFPFHPSLPMHLSRLHQVRTVRLGNIRFSHLVDLRQFISAFRGIRSVTLFGYTRSLTWCSLEECGPLPQCMLAGRPMSLSCESPCRGEPGLPFAFWLSSPSQGLKLRKAYSPEDVAPTISWDVAKFLAVLRPVARWDWISISERWQWKAETKLGKVQCMYAVSLTIRCSLTDGQFQGLFLPREIGAKVEWFANPSRSESVMDRRTIQAESAPCSPLVISSKSD